MKKSIIISVMLLCIVLFGINTVNAVTTNNVSLTASSTTVKLGETFTVTLSAKCEDGINGIDTNYNYDKDKLELVNTNVASNNWASMGTNGTIQVICNSTEKVTSDNIYVLTFKVKDNIESGTTSISTTEIKVDSDVSTSNFTDGPKTVSINITSVNSNISNENNETNKDNENSETNKGNGNNKNEVSEGANTNKKDDTSISNVTKKENQDKTSIKNTTLPKTGDTSYVWIIFALGIVSAIGGYSLIKIKLINKK